MEMRESNSMSSALSQSLNERLFHEPGEKNIVNKEDTEKMKRESLHEGWREETRRYIIFTMTIHPLSIRIEF